MSLSGFLQRFRGAGKSSAKSYAGIGVDPQSLESEAESVKVETEAALIWNHAGNAWLERGDRGKAVIAFLKSADIYVRSDMPVQANAVFAKVLRADSKNLQARLEAARLNFSAGFLVEARGHYLKYASAAKDLEALEDRDIESVRSLLDIDDDGSVRKAFSSVLGVDENPAEISEKVVSDPVAQEETDEVSFELDDFVISPTGLDNSDLLSDEEEDQSDVISPIPEVPEVNDLQGNKLDLVEDQLEDQVDDSFELLDISDFGLDVEASEESDDGDFLDEIARESEADKERRKGTAEPRIVVRGDVSRGSTISVGENDDSRPLAELLDLEDLINSLGDIIDEK